MQLILGMSLGVLTALLWAISPLFWASAGRRIGSLQVNILRMALASLMLLAIWPIYAAMLGHWPAWPTQKQWLWLSVSGAAGMVLGDALYFEAVVRLGARRAILVITLAPVASVLCGWFWLGERMTPQVLVGIALVLGGIGHISWLEARLGHSDKEPGRMTLVGVFLAVAAAVCVGLGAVLGRRAYLIGHLDAVMATNVRVWVSAAIWLIIAVIGGFAFRGLPHLRNPHILSRLLGGTVTGPVAGMFAYLFALKHIEAGLVSTLVALSPLFVLPMVIWRYKVRIGWPVVGSTLVVITGVALIGLRNG